MGSQLGLSGRKKWGGWRAGAGRKAGTATRVAHRQRPEHKERHPVSLTLRVCQGLPSLRRKDVFRVVRRSIAASSREDFRVLHFSVQGNHVHLIAEAADRRRLSSGVQGLSIRTARRVNRYLGRSGHFWGDRYHARALQTPREVRNAIVYVLMNAKKHHPGEIQGLDPCSSAPWFPQGFHPPLPPPRDAPPICQPRTWLAAEGWWRHHGRLSVSESPVPNPRIASARGVLRSPG